MIYGTRISLTIGLTTVACAMAAGIVIGAVSGYFGGRLDNVIMRVMDVFMSIPSVLLAIAVVACLGPGIVNIMIAVGLALVPGYSRVVRSAVLSVRNKEFVQAAKAVGDSHFSIILHHIIPNALAPVIVQATLGVGEVIITAAGLSFLGLGIARHARVGGMLSEGREFHGYMPPSRPLPGAEHHDHRARPEPARGRPARRARPPDEITTADLPAAAAAAAGPFWKRGSSL